MRVVMKRTQRALRKANAVDFDDLLALTVEVLKREPRELERWQTRYRHVLVDEFQVGIRCLSQHVCGRITVPTSRTDGLKLPTCRVAGRTPGVRES